MAGVSVAGRVGSPAADAELRPGLFHHRTYTQAGAVCVTHAPHLTHKRKGCSQGVRPCLPDVWRDLKAL